MEFLDNAVDGKDWFEAKLPNSEEVIKFFQQWVDGIAFSILDKFCMAISNLKMSLSRLMAR